MDKAIKINRRKDYITRIIFLSEDTEEDLIKKKSLVIMSFLYAIGGFLWGLLYFYLGLVYQGWIPMGYSFFSLSSLGIFLFTKNFNFFSTGQLLLMLLLPFFLQLSLGGFAQSSGVIICSFLSPLGATVYKNFRKAIYWFAAFVLLLIAAGALDSFISLNSINMPVFFVNLFYVLNIFIVSTLNFFVMQYYLIKITAAREKIFQMEKNLTQKEMAGSFAHEIRNALAGSKILLEKLLSPAGGRDNGSLPLENSNTMKDIFLLFKNYLPEDKLSEVASLMKRINMNESQIDNILNMTYGSVQRGLSIVACILAFSKIEVNAEPEITDLNELMGLIIDENTEIFRRNNIKVEVESSGKVNLVGPKCHFHSIFNNIILNAKDALSDYEISGSEKKILISFKKIEANIEIKISDNGPGIPEKNINSIFEPFFSTKPETGIGLGLSITKKYVNLYNGVISVRSKVGAGTEFILVFPAVAS